MLTLPQVMQRALAACQRGEWTDAERLCRMVLGARSDHVEAPHLLGMIALQTGRAAEAVELLSRAVAIDPGSADAHYHRGNALIGLKRHAEAVQSYDRALALKPDADAYYTRGIALFQLKRYAEAVASCEHALALKPDYAEAWNTRAIALFELERPAEALESLDRALATKPDYAEAHYNRGIALFGLNRYAEALESCDRALALKPDSADAHKSRGNALFALKRHAEAGESYDRALSLEPDDAEAWFTRGNCLCELIRYAEGLESYDRAIALKPDSADAHCHRGNALFALKRYAEALESYARALKITPDRDFVYGYWLHTKMQTCAWGTISNDFAHLVERIERHERTAPPGAVLATPSSLAIQRLAAEIWVQDKYPADHALPPIPKHPRRDRMRIGYFSADFHEHATSYLMAELFERHDKSRFHITGFSFGPDAGDATRRRVAAAFDAFIDVRNQSDSDVAILAREREIDIAIDLKGFTDGSQPNIFALRAAPIQVSYLGYPGTMGAGYVDYLVADATIIPEAHRQHYAERIAYLPDSYQVNDSTRRISERVFTREELGLPGKGIVLCCFNNSFKINPGTFGQWMSILGRVEGSVLWLLEDNAHAVKNLRMEAALGGIGGDRLVFAPRVPMPEHLARHRCADLFLDTLPCNAHTTASDALWAGLPVLTCLGETFAGRVAASLLKAIGLPELIAETPEQYEGLAVALATDPERLSAIKQKLAANRLTTPLFDARLFTKHLEAAYTAMYERYQADLPPDHIHVQA